jgi:hypothetical protein
MTLTITTVVVCLLYSRHCCAAARQHYVRRERGQFRRVFAHVVGTAGTPPIVHSQVAADGPAQFLQTLCERREAGRVLRIVHGRGHQHADAPHPLALLRARSKRPRNRCASEQRDELAAVHSITSSARPSAFSCL